LRVESSGFAVIKKEKNQKRHVPDISYAFTHSVRSPKKSVLKIIDETKESLDVAMFLFTESDIAECIYRASKKGVRVRVISDRLQTERNPRQSANLARFLEAGIPVKINTHDGNMHLKMMISDNKRITAGSYNYTYSAEQKNDEVFMVIKDPSLAADWKKHFDNMWNDARRFADYSSTMEKTA